MEEPDTKSTLSALIERQFAKVKRLQDVGLSEDQAWNVLQSRGDRFMKYWQTNPDFVEAEDRARLKQRHDFCFYSLPTVMCVALGTALLLNPISRYKFGLLPRYYRTPMRLLTFVTPSWVMYRYNMLESQRWTYYLWDKYGDRLDALELRQEALSRLKGF
jgi:hypothetical protein